jgi:hypothetical protein
LSNKKDFSSLLWRARTKDDIENLIELLPKLFGEIEIKPVGNNPNNAGVLDIASDPGLASVERITNSIDAILEFYAETTTEKPLNPRLAAQTWLKIPKGGISNLSDQDRRRIAQNISVVIDDSGLSKFPTLIVTDKGIGVTSKNFPLTLLSLNQSNKANKGYTMGTFGQGGSSTFRFAEYSLLISRRQKEVLGNEKDHVSFSIVKKHFDDTKMKTHNYSYFCPKNSDGVFTLDPSDIPEMDFGTKITHVAYKLTGFNSVYTMGIWKLYNATIFDPIIPFLVGGDGVYRGSDKTGTRVITGNATRLNNPESARGEIQQVHFDEHTVQISQKYGNIRIKYWVVAWPEDSLKKGKPAESYVSADSAISITLYGQRQDKESRQWIDNKIKLPFLKNNLVIQIETDDLTALAKSELFSSTRERATISEIRNEIYEVLANILLNDKELARLNNIEKDKLLKQTTGAASDKLKSRLGEFIQQRVKGVNSSGDGGKNGKGDKSEKGNEVDSAKKKPVSVFGEVRNTDDTNLPNAPTFIKFEKSKVTITAGKSKNIWVEINAKNGYLQEHEDNLQIIWPNNSDEKLKIQSKSRLLGGKSQWFIKAEEDASREEQELVVKFFTPNGELESSLIVQVIDPSDPKVKQEKSGGSEPNIAVQWVEKEQFGSGEFSDYDLKTVGSVSTGQDSVIVWVNRDFHLLNKVVQNRTLSANQIDIARERYMFPIACALWLQDYDKKLLDPQLMASDQFIKRQNEYLAEAVLTAMNAELVVAGEESEE